MEIEDLIGLYHPVLLRSGVTRVRFFIHNITPALLGSCKDEMKMFWKYTALAWDRIVNGGQP